MSDRSVSFILATHNRCDITLNTLNHVHACGLPVGDFEVFVVDNASTDGTVDAIRGTFPDVHVLPRGGNHGSCAKAFAIGRARGRYVVFLDDDSYPQPGSIERMIDHFVSDDTLGCAGFTVHLPDGRRECSALPNVFIGCGAGFRRDALLSVGGLDESLFMQAEEYDLSFRLINAGYHVQTFDDLHVEHLKTPQARQSARTTYHDTRNNLLLTHRYLSDSQRSIYLRDWTQRYRWLAAINDHRPSFVEGRRAGNTRGRRERIAGRHKQLSDQAFETLFRTREIHDRMSVLADEGVERILLADLGKNVHPFVNAARECGLSILGIADDRFASVGNAYRGAPLIGMKDAAKCKPDAVIVSNTSPVHAAVTRDRWSPFAPPVHAWFAESADSRRHQIASTCPPIPADTSA